MLPTTTNLIRISSQLHKGQDREEVGEGARHLHMYQEPWCQEEGEGEEERERERERERGREREREGEREGERERGEIERERRGRTHRGTGKGRPDTVLCHGGVGHRGDRLNGATVHEGGGWKHATPNPCMCHGNRWAWLGHRRHIGHAGAGMSGGHRLAGSHHGLAARLQGHHAGLPRHRHAVARGQPGSTGGGHHPIAPAHVLRTGREEGEGGREGGKREGGEGWREGVREGWGERRR